VQIQDILAETAVNLQSRQRRELITLRTKTTCTLNATSLFGLLEGSISLAKVRDRMQRIQTVARGLSYSVEVSFQPKLYSYVANLVTMVLQKKVNNKTAIGLGAESAFQGRNASILFFGTVRHQFSPRITTLVSHLIISGLLP